MRTKLGITAFSIWSGLCWAAGPTGAEASRWTEARELYQRTEYKVSLDLLSALPQKNADVLRLMGQDYYMSGEYKKATEVLEKASDLAPADPAVALWLGRAFGRRAETSNPFSAPGYASKSRQSFERAVALDPTDREAIGDLFDYYLGAPGFLGGGMNHAEALAAKVSQHDPAEGHYYQALIAEHRKEYDSAEQHLREALALAPRQAGRFMELGRFLSEHGRAKEGDALFDQAMRLAPENPKLLYERAHLYVKEGRNLSEARKLLEQYLRSPLNPDLPSREEAQALLKKIGA